jgi:Hint domain
MQRETRRLVPNEPATQMRASEFAVGTVILTTSGAMPVEFLSPGDRVITRNGARTLAGIASRMLPMAEMIRVSESTLGVDQPAEDILLAPDQAILIRDWRAKAMTGQDQAMIPAAMLVDGEYIRRETRAAQQVVRLEFDAPVVFYSCNLELAVPATVAA